MERNPKSQSEQPPRVTKEVPELVLWIQSSSPITDLTWRLVDVGCCFTCGRWWFFKRSDYVFQLMVIFGKYMVLRSFVKPFSFFALNRKRYGPEISMNIRNVLPQSRVRAPAVLVQACDKLNSHSQEVSSEASSFYPSPCSAEEHIYQ